MLRPATSSPSGNRRSPQENPSYAEDALDAHLRVLLRWAERSRDPGDAATPEEDVYVWWAKLRSPRRDGELPHAAEIAAIQSQIDDDVETHLYLTDYRSLYVGQLGEVTADAVLEECRYSHQERESKVSDHSVMVTEIDAGRRAERDADLRVDIQRLTRVAHSAIPVPCRNLNRASPSTEPRCRHSIQPSSRLTHARSGTISSPRTTPEVKRRPGSSAASGLRRNGPGS